MPLPRRRRPDFPDQALPQDLAHLRALIAQAPAAAGVYIFHGQDMRLYIGKSVNLRSRLLAHLRNPEEARMLRQTQHISFERTAGELGALLREAQLIKQHRPLYNQKLRDVRRLCSLQWQGDAPVPVFSNELDFATAAQLHGLFGSRQAALDALRDLADAHRLCWGALGLEKLRPGQRCFRAGLGGCPLCRGEESPASHHTRVSAAMTPWRVAPWPWEGAVGLEESDAELRQIHVLRHWSYLGSAATLAQARKLAAQPACFDADVYRMASKPLLSADSKLLML